MLHKEEAQAKAVLPVQALLTLNNEDNELPLYTKTLYKNY